MLGLVGTAALLWTYIAAALFVAILVMEIASEYYAYDFSDIIDLDVDDTGRFVPFATACAAVASVKLGHRRTAKAAARSRPAGRAMDIT